LGSIIQQKQFSSRNTSCNLVSFYYLLSLTDESSLSTSGLFLIWHTLKWFPLYRENIRKFSYNSTGTKIIPTANAIIKSYVPNQVYKEIFNVFRRWVSLNQGCGSGSILYGYGTWSSMLKVTMDPDADQDMDPHTDPYIQK